MKRDLKVDLIKIGNSKGIRLPSWLIDTVGFGKTINMHIENNKVVLSPDTSTRESWDQAFEKASKEEEMIIDDSLGNAWDNEEWTW